MFRELMEAIQEMEQSRLEVERRIKERGRKARAVIAQMEQEMLEAPAVPLQGRAQGPEAGAGRMCRSASRFSRG